VTDLVLQPGLADKLRRSLRTQTALAWGLIGVWLAGTWAINYLVGGSNVVPPHGFYLPILFAAIRFGAPGAAVTALLAAVLAGPLLPADIGTGELQHMSDWMIRGAFFVGIGQCLSVLCRSLVDHERDELGRLADEQELAHAIDAGELRLLFQPIVELDGTVVGAEALVRWDHPQLGLLSPDRFIPFAERTGLIVPLGQWVLQTACETVAQWRQDVLADIADFKISVNMSARELERADYPGRVKAILHQTGVPAEWLNLEITETDVVRDLDTSIEHMHTLKQTGVQLAIDDFGVGHGSLTYIHRFPVDVIKIDRSFVSPIDHDHQLQSVVGGIVLLAHTLDIRTVAEGVETQTQSDTLRELGCDLAQGWLFGRPVPADYLADRIRTQQTREPTSSHSNEIGRDAVTECGADDERPRARSGGQAAGVLGPPQVWVTDSDRGLREQVEALLDTSARDDER
jgi:EAL domain-containing protein (putative c-di-GMP-specific phosphodiesterase class I)